MAERITFTVPEVVEAVEQLEGYPLTDSTLRYWGRSGLVVPAFPGSRGRGLTAKYSVSNLNRVCLIARLLTDGFSLQRVRVILATLDAHYPDALRHRSRRQIVVVGDAVLVRTQSEPTVQLPDGQSLFTFDNVPAATARRFARG